MDIDFRKRIEIEALAKVIDGLDHYTVLKLKPGSPMPQVDRAYARQSKEFHPDRFFGVRDPKFMKQVTTIFKKVNEAYQVLKDPELKKLYDEKMGFRAPKGSDPSTATGRHKRIGGSGSISKAALEAEKAAMDADEIVTDKKAKKYWELAQIAEMNEDWNGVVMNLQFALTYEKENPILKDKLANAKVKMSEKKKKNQNPYKIKIV
jgi:curved DNA-binding protein CbpA